MIVIEINVIVNPAQPNLTEANRTQQNTIELNPTKQLNSTQPNPTSPPYTILTQFINNTDQRFHSYEEAMDRFLDSLKRHVVFPTRNS